MCPILLNVRLYSRHLALLFTDSSKRQASFPSIAAMSPSPWHRTETPGCFPHLLYCQKANSVPWEFFSVCFVFQSHFTLFYCVPIVKVKVAGIALNDTHKGISTMYLYSSHSHLFETSCLRCFKSFMLFKSPYLH